MDTRTEQLIEAFFANEISTTETVELRGRLAGDPEAAAEFAWQQRLAGQVGQLSLRDGIQHTAWQEATRPPFRQVTMWPRMLAAAAAIALLIVAALFIFPPGAASPDDAVAGNFVHYPNKMPFKSLGGPSEGDDQVPPAVLEAFRLYDDPARAHEAAEALGNIAATYPDRLEYRFYQGVALLADRQYAPASAALRPVGDSDNSYKTASFYYLGLAYAGMGEKEQARRALQSYLGAQDEVLTYRNQAQNLLDALK